MLILRILACEMRDCKIRACLFKNVCKIHKMLPQVCVYPRLCGRQYEPIWHFEESMIAKTSIYTRLGADLSRKLQYCAHQVWQMISKYMGVCYSNIGKKVMLSLSEYKCSSLKKPVHIYMLHFQHDKTEKSRLHLNQHLKSNTL